MTFHSDPAAQTFRVDAVNLSTYLRVVARRFAQREAISSGTNSVTWAQLDASVDALASALRSRGIRPGDPVILQSRNSIAFVQTMYAVWRVGAVVVPVNFRSGPSEVAHMALTSGATLMVAQSEFRKHIAAATEWGALPLGHMVIEDDEPFDLSTSTVQEAEPIHDVRVDQNHPAWYFFTSGTSGKPKAAVLTHHTLGFIITNRLADLTPGTTQEDVSLVIAPLSHGAGTHLLSQVARGAKIVLAHSKPMDPAEIFQLIEEHHVTNFFAVPTILKRLSESEGHGEYNHSSLRFVLYGGAPMLTRDRDHARKVFGEKLVQYYGMAEVTGCMTVLAPHEHAAVPADETGVGPAGFARTGVELSIQDESGVERAPGEVGEICAAGLAVFAGYLNDTAANEKAFRNGWFRTGDVGYLDATGCLYVTGRSSDMYISGGHNIYPREIEECLSHHPRLEDVTVVGISDAQWGEIGVAVCVATEGPVPSEREMTDWVGDRLARFKAPRRYVFWQELPKNAYGKVAKTEVRRLFIKSET
ncbi:AMP-binding protein [uncultured Serinicoccus sp.]|uniref:AMP-binding protein n=1 Tax=uncultured Serinicoccus sp. TaxID=735514 RepID=UPI00260299E2|nr:AMP-binding protein [uncultured Serinicoccus sp.]